MTTRTYREIPYNYTSADDQKIVELLFSKSIWHRLEKLRSQRKSGRSARLLMRIIGELFVYFRNPYLYSHLCNSTHRRKHFFSQCDNDLGIIKKYSQNNTDVLAVIEAVEQKFIHLKNEIKKASQRTEKISRILGGAINKENVYQNPLSIISHITDATDWRLYAPVAIARPSTCEQIPLLLNAIKDLGYKVVVRGGGTGLSGGAVPATQNCIIINTEKLNRIYPIESQKIPNESGEQECKVVRVEAGAITEDVMTHAAKNNLVFASDPTSAWASTIGGNISENAGGKSAVKWGTTIDNILSFQMVIPNGDVIQVTRQSHPLRKIMPEDTVTFSIDRPGGEKLKTISLHASQIRKQGLWKDITNKTLGQIPGIQKEGTDGIILEATFVLYDAFPIKKTFCLEFFGNNFNEASHVIEQITRSFTINDAASLIALEHFDQEYVRAIAYKVKSNVSHSPKAVLLIDMASHDETELTIGEKKITDIIQNSPTTEIHIARSDAEARKFWNDRHQFGAIAKRTNAFKLNEDIVLPLNALAPFTDWIEKINLREEQFVQDKTINAVESYLDHLSNHDATIEIVEKIPALKKLCHFAKSSISNEPNARLTQRTVITNLQAEFQDVLSGYENWQTSFNKICKDTLNTVLIVATHMHAGDGNIHVNIPVLSNDAQMMERAGQLVDELMEKTISLNGVVSGEHGIGITKIKYLDDAIIEELNQYRESIDPLEIMNPAKLKSKSILQKVYTPSFNLLELEARILKRGKLETLATKIAHCVRCGKCKANCCVFYPDQNLFFHPRNKNLAIGSLIEAILFDAQRNRDTEFELLKELEEIADHCTICHKCYKPCPVDIDTGEISILERNLLEERGIKKTALATSITLKYLSSNSPLFNGLIHTSVLFMGTRMQKLASLMSTPLRHIRPLAQTYPFQLLAAPMKPAPFSTLHSYLPSCAPNQALMFEGSNNPRSTVFYFPGCGSERMETDISLAALYLLLNDNHRVIVPPPYLCCGFPSGVNGKQTMHNKVVLKDTIILSQIREMFSYLDFDAVAVTCGTCKEALEQMGVPSTFKAPLRDVMSIISPASVDAGHVLYHQPCHDSLEDNGELIISQMGCQVTRVPHCCAEAGTLAISRPDIASAMRSKKRNALENIQASSQASTLLTNCPSCVQGLGKLGWKNLCAVHMTVFAANQIGGRHWKKTLLEKIKSFEKVTV